METSNWKGQLAVAKVQARALEKGFIPSIPTMDCRYDLVLDDGNKLWRIQVKYANGKPFHSNGAVMAKLAYETRHRQHVYTYSDFEVDALIVYIPKLERLCWFPTNVFVGKKVLYIRLTPPVNGQNKKITLAENYFW